ncbi:hypothetical protein, partial [Marinobacter salarius]|uniref:hypothetical protein n=1 Tax=Marinobacter salarius TaxID=1420917 RepID=UPI0032ED4C2D
AMASSELLTVSVAAIVRLGDVSAVKKRTTPIGPLKSAVALLLNPSMMAPPAEIFAVLRVQ